MRNYRNRHLLYQGNSPLTQLGPLFRQAFPHPLRASTGIIPSIPFMRKPQMDTVGFPQESQDS
jgi:hypothetical protein